MTIYLLVYDRDQRKLLRLDEFSQSQREEATRARRDAEIAAIHEGRNQEIVILQAESLDALTHTHGAYFYSVRELSQRLLDLAS
jgi:hypothetical protein